LGTTVQTKLQSGAADIEHGVTYGRQVYDTDKRDWPINQPVTKLEATIQASGKEEEMSIKQCPVASFQLKILNNVTYCVSR
jgi:hypothetical protein